MTVARIDFSDSHHKEAASGRMSPRPGALCTPHPPVVWFVWSLARQHGRKDAIWGAVKGCLPSPGAQPPAPFLEAVFISLPQPGDGLCTYKHTQHTPMHTRPHPSPQGYVMHSVLRLPCFAS